MHMLEPKQTPQMKLRLARVARGMTQSELAAELGINQATASRIENGQQTPKLEIAVAIERAFGIRPSAWVKKSARKRVAA